MARLRDSRVTVIGLGNIGRTLFERLLGAGVPVSRLAICDADRDRASALEARFGVAAVHLEEKAAAASDLLLLATPPKAVPEVLRSLGGALRAGQTIVSFAAAVPLSSLEAMIPSGITVVRVMPSAPSLVGQGMNPVAYGGSTTPETRALVQELLAALGETVEVRDEQMNWCVGLSGAAMRSLLPALEGMTQAGIEAGLELATARRVAAQVMLGTASLALQTDLPFEELKALTPMKTVDEASLAAIFLQAARLAKEKTDEVERKLTGLSADAGRPN